MDNKFKKIAATLIAASMLSASMAVPTFASAAISVKDITKNAQGVVTGATINVTGTTEKAGKGVAAVYTKDGEMKEVAFSTENLAVGTEAGEHTLAFNDAKLKVESGETVKVFLWETDEKGNLASKPLSAPGSDTVPDAEVTLIGTYDYSDITTPAQDALTLTDGTLTVDGKDNAVKAVGYVGGGISGAKAPEANSIKGVAVTYAVEAQKAADDYVIEFVAMGEMTRRLDFSIGEKVYSVEPSDWTESTTMTYVRTKDNASKKVFTAKVANVSLAEGTNSVVVGTKVDETWAPDIIYLNLHNSKAAPAPEVKTYTVSGIVDANVQNVTLTDTTDAEKVFTGTKAAEANKDGKYAVSFANVPNGTYKVGATFTDGYEQDGTSGDVTVADGNVTEAFAIKSKQIVTPATKYTVTGTLGEGVASVVLRPDGATDDTKDVTGTVDAQDATKVKFSVAAGTYTVIAKAAEGYKNAAADKATVTVSETATEVSFTTTAVKKISVKGTVDANVASVTLTEKTPAEGTEAKKYTATPSEGKVTFDDVAAGTYTISATANDGYEIASIKLGDKDTTEVTVEDANIEGLAVTSQVKKYTVTGTVDANVLDVYLVDATDANKKYKGDTKDTTVTFANVPNGTYNVTATFKTNYEKDTITSETVTVNGADVPTAFEIKSKASETQVDTFSVSGTAKGIEKVELSQDNVVKATGTADEEGKLSFNNVLPAGKYDVTVTYAEDYKEGTITGTGYADGKLTIGDKNITDLTITAADKTYAISGEADEHVTKVELKQNDEVKATGIATEGVLKFDNELAKGKYDVFVTCAEGYETGEITGTGYAEGKLTVSGAVTDLKVTSQVKKYTVSGKVDANVANVTLTDAANAETVIEGTKSAEVGEDGKYTVTFEKLPAGEYNIAATANEGYVIDTITVDGEAVTKVTITNADVETLAITTKADPYKVTATLAATASVQGGGNAGGVSNNAEKEFLNQHNDNYFWGYAFTDFALPTGMDANKVVSATLEFTTYVNDAKARDISVYQMANDFDLTGLSGETSPKASASLIYTIPGVTSTEIRGNVDVTSSVKDIITAGNTRALYAFSGCAKGAYVYGKTAETAKQPTLKVVLGEQATLTVKNGDTAVAAGVKVLVDGKEYATDENGQIKVALTVGEHKYSVTETTSYFGVAENSFTVAENTGYTGDIAVEANTRVTTFSVKSGENPVNGAAIIVKTKAGETVGTYTTGEDGTVTATLLPGEYTYEYAEGDYLGVAATAFTVAEGKDGATVDIALTENAKKATTVSVTYKTADGTEIKPATEYSDKVYVGEKFTMPAYDTVMKVVKDGKTEVYNYVSGAKDIETLAESGNVIDLVYELVGTYDYYEDYNTATAETSGWVSDITDRYTVALDGTDDKYVNVAAVGNGGNGTTVSNTGITLGADKDYVAEFDLALTGANGQTSGFAVKATSGYALVLQLKDTKAITWIVNGTTEVDLEKGTFYHYKLEKVSEGVKVTITSQDGATTLVDGVTYANDTATTGEFAGVVSNAGIAGMQFNTKRYYAGMKFDNLKITSTTPVETTYTVTGTADANVTKVTLTNTEDAAKTYDAIPVAGESGSTVTFENIPNGTYSVTAKFADEYELDGTVENVVVDGSNKENAFAIKSRQKAAEATTYTVTGTVTEGATSVTLKNTDENAADGTKTYTGKINGTTVTFDKVAAGTYTVSADYGEDYTVAIDKTTITVDEKLGETSAFIVTATKKVAETYAVTRAEATNGSFEVSAESAAKDTEITVTATPDEGCELDKITVTKTGTDETVDVTDNKFTMPESNVTVTVTFKKTAYDITKGNILEGAGSFTVKKADANDEIKTANFGDKILLKATVNEGFTFKGFTIDGVELTKTTNENEFTFTMPAKAITVNAEFVATGSAVTPEV